VSPCSEERSALLGLGRRVEPTQPPQVTNRRVQRILNVAAKYGWSITPSTVVPGCYRLNPPSVAPEYDDGFTVFTGPNHSASVMRDRDWTEIPQRDAMALIASR
jgi:hypothetical protein